MTLVHSVFFAGVITDASFFHCVTSDSAHTLVGVLVFVSDLQPYNHTACWLMTGMCGRVPGGE